MVVQLTGPLVVLDQPGAGLPRGDSGRAHGQCLGSIQCTSVETEINIPFITSTTEGPQHLLLKMTRAQLESIADEYIARSIESG